MTSQKLARVGWTALILALLAIAIGCDDRKDAELPPTVYSLSARLVLPGVAQFADLKENMLAVAASSAGTYVYNISNASLPAQVFHYEQQPPFYTTFANIDPVNHLVLTVSEPDLEPGDKYPIHNYETGTVIGYANFSGGIEETAVISDENKFFAWRSDNGGGDGLVYSEFCYIPDSARWRPTYCQDFYFPFIPGNFRIRGFGVSGDLFAVAQSNFQFLLYDVANGTSLGTIPTPGDPQDCAWYGDNVVVADNFFVTIMNVADPSAPVLAASLTIPGADRLVRVVLDGDYACLLDDADGFYVVDIADPTTPKFVQKFDLPEPTSITASNGKVVVTDEQLGVLIYER
ncbi:MAG: hypothetical protein H6508_06995 [Calditrichaeota bacterium]|nr:hypothetical protein [Calditrichota bacterium]